MASRDLCLALASTRQLPGGRGITDPLVQLVASCGRLALDEARILGYGPSEGAEGDGTPRRAVNDLGSSAAALQSADVRSPGPDASHEVRGGLQGSVAIDGSSDGRSLMQPMDPIAACGLLSQLASAQQRDQGHASPSAPPPTAAGAVDALLRGLTPRLPSLSARQLAWLLHSLALLQHRPHARWTARLCELLRTRLPAMRAEELAGVLWSLARLNLRPGARWMDWALLESQSKLGQFGAQEMSNAVWALAR